jgi:hypothetical protein
MTDTLDRADIQGIIARGYSSLGHALFTLFACETSPPPRVAQWLLPRITSAARRVSRIQPCRSRSRPRPGGWLPEQAVAGFSLEFRRLAAPNRSRFWATSASRSTGLGLGGWTGQRDGLILLYASSAELLDERRGNARQFAASGARPIAVLDTLERQDREPLAFDGISQPLIQERRRPAGRQPSAGYEFVLGYRNGSALTDRPLLPRSADPRKLLPPDPGGSGQADLGRNGTYLVLRQLEQDVDGFWRYVAEATRRPDGSDDRGAQDALAAKLVGRWRSGAPLVRAPDRDDPALAEDNDFGYHHGDPLGLACPLGAHIRRANLRDSLDPRPGTDASLQVNSLHRLLPGRNMARRGPAAHRTGRVACNSSARPPTRPGSSSSCSTPG